jgi:hypothetical protein
LQLKKRLAEAKVVIENGVLPIGRDEGEGTAHCKNFEQVDELRPDAINLTLVQKGLRCAVLNRIIMDRPTASTANIYDLALIGIDNRRR